MRLRTGFQGDTTAGQGPRVGLAVAHAGWRGDLERALVSAGCRVVPIPGSPSLEREAGIDVFVGDAEAAPASFGLGEDPHDRVVVWSAEGVGLLKYSHNSPVQALCFNPVLQSLASCTNDDFGLWQTEGQNVNKFVLKEKCLDCDWSPDGQILAIALYCGKILLRDKNGAELT